jgi:L-iditol 2-dehydrogenase
LHPYTSYPVVQGHEASGVIAQVGAEAKGFTRDDKVVFMPQVYCGECYPCCHGMYHICDNLKVMGFQTDGAAQEYFSISSEKVLKLPVTLSLEHAALIEPISVAVHALSRYGNVAGLNVMVLGAGTIGNLVAQVAMASGAKRVLITDISEYKLDKARQCGLTDTVNSTVADLGEVILKTFGVDNSDLILECVGVQDTISQAIAIARKGSTIVVVGVYSDKPTIDLGLVQDRELTVVGTLMYQRKDYERAIELVSKRKLHLAELITHRFAFREYLEAYKAIDASGGRYMKVMIGL